jgi:hypothetical protein
MPHKTPTRNGLKGSREEKIRKAGVSRTMPPVSQSMAAQLKATTITLRSHVFSLSLDMCRPLPIGIGSVHLMNRPLRPGRHTGEAAIPAGVYISSRDFPPRCSSRAMAR